MNHRSWLLVPGDREDRLGQAVGTGADVIVVDLEDGVAPAMKPAARQFAARWLAVHRQQITEQKLGRWVRINSLDSGLWREDLVSILSSAPDGIILPKVAGPDDVRQLAAELYELEQRHRVPSGSISIIPLVGETPRAALSIAGFADALHQRVAGLSWGASDLSAALGASRHHADDGGWTDAFRFVRAQTLLAAHACGIMAIDALNWDFRDEQALRKAARDARADGFAGMLAIHPDQVPVINEAFGVPDDELAMARRIIAAFGENPGSGAVEFEGRVFDHAQLRLARRVLDSGAARATAKTPVLRPA